jgi:hypothetical protein
MHLCLITGIILTIPFYIIKIDNIALSICLKILAVILYPIILYLSRFFERIEIDTIHRFVNKYVHLSKIKNYFVK